MDKASSRPVAMVTGAASGIGKGCALAFAKAGFNVLLGDMSVVGPRPHAVAHNEQYRRQVSRYMLRHKVKPGITGWAQVNGCRGETETLDKMKRRIDYDLEYLRHWSFGLDLRIILRTVGLMHKDPNAY